MSRKIRILAVEEGRFSPERKGKALLVGVIVAPDTIIEDVLFSWITVDGLDVTGALIEMVERCGKKPDLIMLASIPYAGFNLMDPIRIYEESKIPVVVVNPEKPDNEAVRRALVQHFKDWKERLAILDKVGDPFEAKVDDKKSLFVHSIGISKSQAIEIIKKSIIVRYRPEPLRVARLIARGLTLAAL